MNKNMLDNAIWQLYATQLLQQSLAKAQQQAAQNGHKNLKNNSTGITNDQLIKAAELAAGTSKTGTPSPSASLGKKLKKKKLLARSVFFQTYPIRRSVSLLKLNCECL